MAEIDGELLFEILRKLQADVSLMKDGLNGVREEIVSVRVHQMGMQNDIHNIYAMLARSDQRLERIEHRLELRELAEPQRPFDPS